MYREEDAKTIANMEPMLTQKFAELADEVERTVPSSGDSKPLSVFFEDKTKCLDIVYWSLSVCYYDSLEDKTKIYDIVLYGYITTYYAGSCTVSFGPVEKCIELLKSPALVKTVMKSMKNILNRMDYL